MKREIRSPVAGTISMQPVSVGQKVFAGTAVIIVESMKMEVPVETDVDGEVVSILDIGTSFAEGDVIVVIDDEA